MSEVVNDPNELNKIFKHESSIPVEIVTKEELDRRIAEFKNRKAKDKEGGKSTPKETKPKIQDKEKTKGKKSSVAEVKNESEINKSNTKDEKYLYTLTCDHCSEINPDFKPGERELSEWGLEQLMSHLHTGCGIGKVVVIDRKPLPFHNPKLENKFNPCKNKCWYNSKSDSYNGGLKCNNTADDFLGCQDLVINDKLDKIGAELNVDFDNIKIEYKFNPCNYDCWFNADDKNSYKGQWECPKTEDLKRSCQHSLIYNKIKKISKNGLVVNPVPNEVYVKYDDGHTVKVHVKDIWRLFVIRNCFSKQDKSDPDSFGVMPIKDDYGIGERLIDKNGKVYHKPLKLGDEPLTNKIIVDHLNGEITIGVHQINADGLCKWLCYDIDKDHVKQGTPEELADKIIKYLKDLHGLTGYKEKSGSIDSFHVWLFFEPVKMEDADKFDKKFTLELRDKGVNIDDAENAITGVFKDETEEGNEEETIEKKKVKKEVYGKMIKLPFGIQNKEKDGYKGGKSEFLGDLSKIQPEILPVIE